MESYIAVSILSLAGIVMFFFVLKRLIETFAFIRSSQRTSAVVVNNLTARDSDGRATYLPVLEFKIRDAERIIRFTASVASNPPAYKIGEQAEVRYLPKNPQAARINSFSDMWSATIVIAGIGIVCFAAAVIFFLSE